jgi:hypothetical protein
MCVSAVLFAARAIIEQRKVGQEDVGAAAFAFLGDVMTVFFTLWIATMLLGAVSALLLIPLAVALVALPIFETVAFGAASGFAIFPSAWAFFRRDFGAWLVGQVPLVVLAVLYAGLLLAVRFALAFVPEPAMWLAELVADALPNVVLVAYLVYRGVLYLTLDGLSPRRRAEKFGGATPIA